jgi:GNAT superfamily N-acetyltransferase
VAVAGTTFSIRPVQEDELEAWLALRNQTFVWPAGRELFVFSESLRSPGEPLLRLGAWTESGELAGTAEAYVGDDGEQWVERAEAFVAVAPAHRRQGLGARLASEAENFARGLNLRWLEVALFERHLSLAKPLLDAGEFVELERYQESAQRPASVSLGGLDELRNQLRRSGIETVAFPDVDSPSARRSLYRCAMEVEHDMPHEPLVEWRDPPFETWTRKVFERPGSSADSIFVARDGDQIVGLSYLVMRENGEAEVGDTGVLPTHRRRGIARTLKIMATQWAAARGIPRVHTDNRADNAAMLAINTELGFEPGEVIVVFEKTLRS